DSGEAFFAASGSNLRVFRSGSYFLVSGGMKSRLLSKSTSTLLPIIQGKETTGANSIDIYDNGNPDYPGKRMIVVGGDFNAPASIDRNCFYTTNGGKSWKAPKTPPHGYRSSVEYLSQKDIVSCGLNGIDYSNDGGKTWRWISKESFNVCRIARNGSAFFLAGSNGKVARLNWDY
ncbi:MAG: oxidoreductase, partial [Chitinophagaceae bacterium]|nr:oxidoreductase [Chitinophagaceae bacterium]